MPERAGTDSTSAPAVAPPAGETAPPAVMRDVLVYFAHEEEGDPCEVRPVVRRVPDGPPLEVVRRALAELLAGPTAEELAAGFRSSIPDTLEILRDRMRHVTANDDEPHRGRRVEIQSLEAGEGGLLHVSFSPEINAYGGGSARVCTILRQIRETVRQFSAWKDVVIAVDGRTEGVLQP